MYMWVHPLRQWWGRLFFLFGGGGVSGYNAGPMVDARTLGRGTQEGGGDRAYGFGVWRVLINHHTAVMLKRRATFAVAHNSPLRGEERSSTQW